MNENELAEKALDQSLELNKIQADLLKEKHKSNRVPWIMAVITLFLFFVTNCIWIWLWNQYDTVSSYEANGIYAIIDSDGNILAQDVTQEQLDAFTEWWELNGDSQSDKSTN